MKRFSEGVFPIRVSAYMLGYMYKKHQEAFLVYNKKGIARKEALKKLANMEAVSKTYTGFIQDINNPNMVPMLNPHNYAPLPGGSYKNPNLVSISELHACIGMKCNIKKHGNVGKLAAHRFLILIILV